MNLVALLSILTSKYIYLTKRGEKTKVIKLRLPEADLHLSDREILVQPVHPGQHEQLGGRGRQEVVGQVFEPAPPVGLSFRQVHRPGVRPVI